MAGVPSLPGPSSRPGFTGDLAAPLEQRGQLLKTTIFSGTAATMAAIAPNCAAGHLLAMTGTWASTADLVSAGTIADDAGNTWHIGPVGSGQNPGVFIVWSLLANALTPANTITLTFSSGTPAARMCQFIDYGTGWTGLDSSTSGSAASGAQSASATSSAPGDAVVYATGFDGQTDGNADFHFNTDLSKIGLTHHTGTTSKYLATGDALAPSAGVYSTGANGNQNQSTWAVALLLAAVIPVPPPRLVLPGVFVAAQYREARRPRIVASSVQLAAASAGSAPIVTPNPYHGVIRSNDVQARQRRGCQIIASVVQSRASGVTAPTLTPLPKQTVIPAAVWTSTAQQNRARHSHIIQQRAAAEQFVVTPPDSIVVGQAEQAAVRRARHGSVVQSRWPGYEWVGLAPVTPTPRQIVQDQAAVWQSRQDHRRGLVVEPGVQTAAATASAAPVTPPLPKQVVQDQAALSRRQQQHAGRVVQPSVQLAAASAPVVPVTTPLPRQIIILARATPRQARSGHVIQPRTLQAPVAPPRTVNVIDLCPATSRRQRGGHVVIGRPVTQPATPRRPQLPRLLPRRPQRRGSVTAVHGRFVQPSGATTLITTPLTGYVSVGDHGFVASGATGQIGSGDAGTISSGSTGHPQT